MQREISDKIQRIIEAPPKKYTTEEAEQVLKGCGVLDENGEIKAAFQDILIRIGEVPKAG